MANDLQNNTSQSVAGLGTFSFTVVTAGMYTVAVQSTIPHDPGSQLYSYQTSPQASALQIAIKLNGVAQVTIGGSATNPTPNQPSMGTSARLQCAAADVIAVTLSSGNAVDNQPNSVKSTINLYQGE